MWATQTAVCVLFVGAAVVYTADVDRRFPSTKFNCDGPNGECPWITKGWKLTTNTNLIQIGHYQTNLLRVPHSPQKLQQDLVVKFDLDAAKIKEHMKALGGFSKDYKPEKDEDSIYGHNVLVALVPDKEPLRHQLDFHLVRFNEQGRRSGLHRCHREAAPTARQYFDYDGSTFALKCQELLQFDIASFRSLRMDTGDGNFQLWSDENKTKLVVNYSDPSVTQMNYFTFMFSVHSKFGVGLNITSYTPVIHNTNTFCSPVFHPSWQDMCLELEYESDEKSFAVEVSAINTKENETRRLAELQSTKPGLQQGQFHIDMSKVMGDGPLQLLIETDRYNGPPASIVRIDTCVPQGGAVVAGTQPPIKPEQLTKKEPEVEKDAAKNPVTDNKTVTAAPVVKDVKAVRDLKVKFVNSSSVAVQWSPPEVIVGKNMSYTVTYKCVYRLGCKEACPEQREFTTSAITANLTGLLPYTQYTVTVSTQHANASLIVNTTMSPKPTEVALTSAQQPNRTDSRITVYWAPVPVCSGPFRGYAYYIYKAENSTDILKKGSTTDTNVTFTDILPGHRYIAKVFIETEAGRNEDKYLEIDFLTKETIQLAGAGHVKASSASTNMAASLISCFTCYCGLLLLAR